MNQWDWVFQTSPTEATNDTTGVVYKMEIGESFKMNWPASSTKEGEHILLTDPNGKRYRCWRHKHPDNSYAIVLKSKQD